ncbi:MAG: GIY-YIG nuclease family protein [Patescibacteria group bacterium]
MFFVYLIRCDDGSLYTGISTDYKTRFSQHAQGKGARYTRMRKPVRIVHIEEYRTKSEALKRERQVKGWRREKKETLIRRTQSMPG